MKENVCNCECDMFGTYAIVHAACIFLKFFLAFG